MVEFYLFDFGPFGMSSRRGAYGVSAREGRAEKKMERIPSYDT